jgi:hypothetical protein
VSVTARWSTSPGQAALGLLWLHGSPESLAVLLGPLPPVGGMRLGPLADVDQGVVMRIRPHAALLTPHGGPRIRQRLTGWLLERGVTFTETESWDAFSSDPLERRMLAALVRAASADAVPLLLEQPRRWRAHGPPTERDRCLRLRRLIDPPTVAIVGPPNAGKSSLLNALAGRQVAAASPVAGTTRDYVQVQVTLAGLASTVVDAPGLRSTDDPIETEALANASACIRAADLRLSVAAPGQAFLPDWPDAVRVRTMADLPEADPAGTQLRVSAHTGSGLGELAQAVRQRLVPDADLRSDLPFDFDGPA